MKDKNWEWEIDNFRQEIDKKVLGLYPEYRWDINDFFNSLKLKITELEKLPVELKEEIQDLKYDNSELEEHVEDLEEQIRELESELKSIRA